jgi:hypothetical protein
MSAADQLVSIVVPPPPPDAAVRQLWTDVGDALDRSPTGMTFN